MSLVAMAMSLALAADVPAWAAGPPPPLPENMHRTMERYRYFATCTATRSWDQERGLFETRIGSCEEQQALSRRVGACLRPGQRLQANPLTLRPWLAEAQYQSARARRPDSAD